MVREALSDKGECFTAAWVPAAGASLPHVLGVGGDEGFEGIIVWPWTKRLIPCPDERTQEKQRAAAHHS